MNLHLQDKAVLVFASSGGIGRGVATEFAREGAKVMLFARSEDKLAATAEAIAAETGNRPLYTVGDLTDAASVQGVIDRTVAEFGGLWALFNNTGGPPAGGFDAFDDAAWQSAFELTVLGYVRAIRAALPHLRAGGGGRIVNNTSVSTKQADRRTAPLECLPHRLVGLGKSLSRELGRDGILVNTVGADASTPTASPPSTRCGRGKPASRWKSSAPSRRPPFRSANTANRPTSPAPWSGSARARTAMSPDRISSSTAV
jgi:3-oxoacyl-[acyl-carrier protein] reductase